jgi:hypothetical protein
MALAAAALAGTDAPSGAAPAAADIAKLFDTYPLVMMGEWHRSTQQHAFLRALVRDPAFACRVDDIVIEFGNARLQDVADRYASGQDVGEAELQSMWRETEVPFAWNSPVYRQFYETVREVNAKKLCAHPLRIVLGDPPIDWAKVKNVKDLQRVEDRDVFFAGVAEREVIARNRRALLISGELHALKASPPGEKDGPPDATVAQILERKYPGRFFTVVLVTAAAADAMKMGTPPSFRIVRGTELDRADFGMIAPAWKATPVVVNGKHDWKLEAAKTWPTMGEVVDGVLYLGGDETRLFPSPEIYLEPAYQTELRRRIRIIKEYNGQDFMPILDDLVKEAMQPPKAK